MSNHRLKNWSLENETKLGQAPLIWGEACVPIREIRDEQRGYGKGRVNALAADWCSMHNPVSIQDGIRRQVVGSIFDNPQIGRIRPADVARERPHRYRTVNLQLS
jgi:hypothetical protein